jgi:hemoglobin/transferrin/lactoferrin receptor protein
MMGLVRSRTAALLGGVALGAIALHGAAAQSNINAGNVTLLERLVIGAGRAPKVAIDTPQAVTVINQAEIDQAQATTTGGLFETVPGVTIVGSDRQLGEAFNIRGIGTTENSSDGSRIVVNVDGVPKFFEQYRMGSFFSDPELYKQVEVLRGPASSTLYGAGAIGGVINFTTKDASDFIKDGYNGAVRVKAGFSSNGLQTLTSAVLAQQISETFEVLAAGNWRRQENVNQANGNLLDGSEFSTLSGLVKGTMHFGDNDEQTLRASYQHFNSETDQSRYAQTGVTQMDPFGFIDRKVVDKTAVIEWSNPDTDNPWIDTNVAFSFSDTINEQRNHRATPNGPLSNAAPPAVFADQDFQYRTYQLTADNTVEWIGDGFENYFTAGFQASSQHRLVTFPSGAAVVPTHPEGTEKRLGVFVQDEFIWDDRLTIVAGLRGDGHWVDPASSSIAERDGYAFSPKLAALYEFNDAVSIFGSVAHTERLPTIDELYSSVDPTRPGGRNPAGSSGKTRSLDLRKEQANSIEGGIALSGYDLALSGDVASLKATAFYSRITDMIASNEQNAFGAPPPSYYGNIAEAELYGLEIEGAYSSDYVFANLAYTLTIGNDLVTDTPLRTVPQNKVVVTLGARNPEWHLEYGARVTLADEGRYIVASSPNGMGADGTAEGYGTLDLFASWKPDYDALAGTELQASIDNFFNADYRENLSTNRSVGRTFKLTLAKQFDY